MAGWRTHTGRCALLPRANIDTDQLIPARFMSVPRAQGYGDYLLHDVRRDATGAPDPRFPLNQNGSASVLIAGANFGCGSSREAAVYALVDAGFRAVIAPSFGDIFAANAVNNGLLPAQVDAANWQAIQSAESVEISLDSSTLSTASTTAQFNLEDSWRTKLINGWDDIDLTAQHAAAITAFKDTYRQTAGWAWPAAVD